MQGSIENFFKVFDEAKRKYDNIRFTSSYVTYWRLTLEINNKTVFDLRGNETNSVFDNAAHKLFEYMRK